MKFICFFFCFTLFCCGCQRDDRFAELDVRCPFGFEVGGDADEAIKRGGWELRATLQSGPLPDGLAGAGGEFTKVTGLRFKYVGLDWKNRLFTRIEAVAAESATEDVARDAYNKLCTVVKQKFGRDADECNKNQPLYSGVIVEEHVWKEKRHGHTFAYKVQLDQYFAHLQSRAYWSALYTAEDIDLTKEVFQRKAHENSLTSGCLK